jgi:hypothetical protein
MSHQSELERTFLMAQSGKNEISAKSSPSSQAFANQQVSSGGYQAEAAADNWLRAKRQTSELKFAKSVPVSTIPSRLRPSSQR